MNRQASGPSPATASAVDPDDIERLRWQCRRGMLELDLLLNRFLDHGYGVLDEPERDAFVRLLGYEDQILQDWLIGHAVPADPALSALADRIRVAMRGDSGTGRMTPTAAGD